MADEEQEYYGYLTAKGAPDQETTDAAEERADAQEAADDAPGEQADAQEAADDAADEQADAQEAADDAAGEQTDAQEEQSGNVPEISADETEAAGTIEATRSEGEQKAEAEAEEQTAEEEPSAIDTNEAAEAENEAEEAEEEASQEGLRKVGSAPAKQSGGDDEAEAPQPGDAEDEDVGGEANETDEQEEQAAEVELDADEEGAVGEESREQTEAQDDDEKQMMEKENQTQGPVEPVAPAPTQANLEKHATVKIVLLPGEQVLTVALPLSSSIGQIKSYVGAEAKFDSTKLAVLFNGKEVQDHFVIADFGVDANESIAYEVQSCDQENYPLRLQASKPHVSGDVITIRVPTPDGKVKEVNVEIEKQHMRKKPFLGGYRHKQTNVEYHHAQTQTNPKPKPPSLVPVFSRDTQTIESKHETQQTSNDTSTQMTKPGVYVSALEDKMVIPGRYENADQFQSRMLGQIVTIQTYYRRWLAKQYVVRLKTERDARLEWEREEEIRKRKEKEERAQREFERRMNPKTKEDFDLLYSTLERWRQEELDRINATLTGAERKAALCQLLDQETELIAAVDRHQLDSSKENKEKAIQSLLKKAAAPKKWRNQEGQLLEMDTPFTLRGRELLGIYNSLQMKYLTQDERLDVLLTVKHTVKEHECKLTSELIELIDREADLLIRGVAEEKLTGLRKRISTLFLQYCKTPTFNPEITDLLPVPQDPAQLKNNIHYCSSCGRYLKSTEFPLGIKSSNIGKCRKCLSKDNAARSRQDQSAYKRMLWFLRKKEGGEALLIEEADLKYLVNNIWEGQSILSCWDDLADLELARWDMNKPWSPTNCIMLTKDEAEAHESLTDLGKAYGNMLVHRVKQKHVLAKNYFHSITSAAEKMKLREMELRNVRLTTK